MGDKPQRHGSLSARRWGMLFGAAAALAGVSGWLYTDIAIGQLDWASVVSAAFAGLALAAATSTAVSSIHARRMSDLAIDAGRERVREAEREVEGALAARGSFVVSRGTLTYSTSPAEVSDEDVMDAEPEDLQQALAEAHLEGREEALAEAHDTVRLFQQVRNAKRAEAEREARDLALAQLWTLTHRRLDLYHEIATNQARRSFTSAQISMGIGFGLLVLFVVLALNVSDTAGAIVTGGLGAVSAALAGFISKTFVTSQQTAADHLKAYFDQPLEFSRYLAAERLLADAGLSEEKRAEVVAVLVQTIAAGPGAVAPAEAGGAAGQPQA